MPRIAILLPRFSLYGGVERFGYRLAEALAEQKKKQGYTVDFLCARQEHAAPAGVRVREVGRFGGFAWCKLLWFLVRTEMICRRENYDLVISLGKSWNQDLLRVGGGAQKIFWQMSERAWAAGILRKIRHLRRILAPVNWITAIVEKRQYNGRCRVVCVSDAVACWLRQEYPDMPQPEVIYNLPDLTEFAPPLPEEQQKAREKLAAFTGTSLHPAICIGTATSNFRLKGTDNLIRAMALLPQQFRLYIAGGRSDRRCRRLARRLGVAERVIFMGKVDDMRAFYHGLDMFVLPTFYDACSNAVLEARACGLPVISSICNGSSIFLQKSQILHNPGDVQDIAKHILALGQPEAFQIPENIHAGLDTWLKLIDEMTAAQN